MKCVCNYICAGGTTVLGPVIVFIRESSCDSSLLCGAKCLYVSLQSKQLQRDSLISQRLT